MKHPDTRWYQEIRIVVMSMASVYDTRHRHDDDTNFLIPPRMRLVPSQRIVLESRNGISKASLGRSLFWTRIYCTGAVFCLEFCGESRQKQPPYNKISTQTVSICPSHSVQYPSRIHLLQVKIFEELVLGYVENLKEHCLFSKEGNVTAFFFVRFLEIEASWSVI